MLGSYAWKMVNNAGTYRDLDLMWEKFKEKGDYPAALAAVYLNAGQAEAEVLGLNGRAKREITVRWKLNHDEWQEQFQLMTGRKRLREGAIDSTVIEPAEDDE